MKFRVKIQCGGCSAEGETWVEGSRQYVAGEIFGSHTDLWEICEADVEPPPGWERRVVGSNYIFCPECQKLLAANRSQYENGRVSAS